MSAASEAPEGRSRPTRSFRGGIALDLWLDLLAEVSVAEVLREQAASETDRSRHRGAEPK